MADTLSKQPNESRLYDMDFSPKMSTGEEINGIVSVTETTVNDDETETVSTDLTFGAPTFNLQLAQVRISAGLDDTLYKITFLATTDLGNTIEAEGLLCVEDK